MAQHGTGSSVREIDTGQQLSTRQLSCAICLEPYKDPRILKCSHSFCRRCLVRVLEGHDRHSLRAHFRLRKCTRFYHDAPKLLHRLLDPNDACTCTLDLALVLYIHVCILFSVLASAVDLCIWLKPSRFPPENGLPYPSARPQSAARLKNSCTPAYFISPPSLPGKYEWNAGIETEIGMYVDMLWYILMRTIVVEKACKPH